MAVADKLSALRIKANLIADDRIGMMDISAEVHDGVAILRGEVHSEEQRAIAEELAYDVDEIEEVQNEINVMPESEEELEMEAPADSHLGYGMVEGDIGDTPFAIGGESAGPGPAAITSEQFPGEFSDDEIDQEVTERLEAQEEVDASGIKHWTANQIVHLKGALRTEEDLNKLQDIILNARGVMGIRSEVVIEEGSWGTPIE